LERDGIVGWQAYLDDGVLALPVGVTTVTAMK
jgi:hypothetical protein